MKYPILYHCYCCRRDLPEDDFSSYRVGFPDDPFNLCRQCAIDLYPDDYAEELYYAQVES